MLNSYVCTFLLLYMQDQNPISTLLCSVIQGGQFSCIDHQSISASLSLVSNFQEFMPIQIDSDAGMGTRGIRGEMIYYKSSTASLVMPKRTYF